MKLFRVSAFLLVAGALAACKNDTAGTLVTLPPLAGLRYVNVSPDTGALDFRIVDAVAYAPNQVGATFRTGGAPSGISTGGFLPLYQAVAAGSHEIRVFLNSTNPTVASTVLLDTTYTFVAGSNYSFYAYGYANAANGTPSLGAVIVADTAPTLAANQFGLRVLNLAPSLAGNPAGLGAVNLDGFVGLTTTAVPIPGAPSFVNMSSGNVTPYVAVATNAAPYRLAMTQTGFGTPVAIQATLPLGAAGNSITQPIPGTAVAGTVITAVLVPRSIAGSAAPQTAAASVSTNIDSIVRSNDTVTVWRHITPGNGGATAPLTCNAPVAAGAAANDIVNISGVTQPEYNGSQSIVSVTAGTAQTVDTARQTVTLAAGTAGSTFRLSFGGQQTGFIAFDETAATVQTALAALTSIGGTANVGVTGAAGGPFVVVFKGTFLGTNPVSPLTVSAVTGTVTGSVAVNYGCLGNATSSRFRYRIAGVPASPSTGAPAFKVVTSGTADFTIPSILFMVDVLPTRTAP